MQDIVATQSIAKIDINQKDADELQLVLSGDWRSQLSRPVFVDIEPSLRNTSITKLTFDSKAITAWDTALPVKRIFRFRRSMACINLNKCKNTKAFKLFFKIFC